MARGRPRKTQPQVPFAYKLVLNQWLLSLFNVRRFEDLAEEQAAPVGAELPSGSEKQRISTYAYKHKCICACKGYQWWARSSQAAQRSNAYVDKRIGRTGLRWRHRWVLSSQATQRSNTQACEHISM